MVNEHNGITERDTDRSSMFYTEAEALDYITMLKKGQA